MSAAREFDLDHRLAAYFATIRSSSLREALERSAENWQMYAAVTGAAMAMVTSASAAIIGGGIRDIRAERAASVRAAKQHSASSRNVPLLRAVRLAMARQDAGERFFDGGGKIASVSQVPSISPGGIVPLCSTVSIIQPGELVSIYGTNLAGTTAVWNNDFPTVLGGTSVTIDGRKAFLLFVSPGQINLQAPDDTARGTVSVAVITAGGTATSTVTLSRYSPSFNLLDTRHVAGIILRSNGSGAYGGGTYDILGPTGNSLGYPTVAAQAGDTVELFAVGFGPTTPAVPAGEAFSGAAPINSTFSLYINNIVVRPIFVGLSSAGVYQINLVVPTGLGEGDVPIQAMVGGMQTQPGALLSLQNIGGIYSGSSGLPVGGGSGGFGGGTGGFGGGSGGFGGGSGGGSGGGPGGGSGDGSGGAGGGSGGGTGGGSFRTAPGGSAGGALRNSPGGKPYEPTLRFTPT